MNAPFELSQQTLEQAAASASARQATPEAAKNDMIAKTRLARASMPGVPQATEAKVTLGVLHAMAQDSYPLNDPVGQQTWRYNAYEKAQTIAEKTGATGVDVAKVVESAQNIANRRAVLLAQESQRRLGVREGLEARVTSALLEAMTDSPFPLYDAIAVESWRCSAFERAQVIADGLGVAGGISVKTVVNRAHQAAYNQAVSDARAYEQQQKEQADLDTRWTNAAYWLGFTTIEDAREKYPTIDDAEAALSTLQAEAAADENATNRRSKSFALAAGGALAVAAFAGNTWPVVVEETTTAKIQNDDGSWEQRQRIRDVEKFSFGTAALAGAGAFIVVFAAADFFTNNGDSFKQGLRLLSFFRGVGG